MFDQPYNRDAAEPRARTWQEVEQIVIERFTAWRGAAGVQPQLPGIDAGKDRLALRRSVGVPGTQEQ